MSRGATAANAARRGSPPPVSLEAWPVSEGGLGTWATLAVLPAVPMVVGLVTGDTSLGVAAAVLMLIAGWRFFVPAVYQIDALGITERILWTQRRISWRAVAGIDVGRRGVLVIPDVGCCPRLRGLYLPWGAQREALLALFAYHLGMPAEPRHDVGSDAATARQPLPAEEAAHGTPSHASIEQGGGEVQG